MHALKLYLNTQRYLDAKRPTYPGAYAWPPVLCGFDHFWPKVFLINNFHFKFITKEKKHSNVFKSTLNG
jgi:hypothetical protein